MSHARQYTVCTVQKSVHILVYYKPSLRANKSDSIVHDILYIYIRTYVKGTVSPDLIGLKAVWLGRPLLVDESRMVHRFLNIVFVF